MKRMSNQLFNLLDEPWIRVMDKDGAVEEKSIYDVLLHAQDYLRLAGETETQNLPVFRILEAILLAIYAKYDANGNFDPIEESEDASERWGELWEHKHFEEKPLREYLETYRDRFWLRDDQYPFMQSIKAKDGTDYKTSKLIGELSESNNKVRLFQSRLGEGKEKLYIVVAAKEDLTIASGSASLLIAADNVLQVRQGGTSMTLNKDISFTGGEFRIQ